MSRALFSLAVAVLPLLASGVVFAQGETKTESSVASVQKEGTKFGIGFQASFPGYGISGIVDVTDKVSIQGILDFIGDLNRYRG